MLNEKQRNCSCIKLDEIVFVFANPNKIYQIFVRFLASLSKIRNV